MTASETHLNRHLGRVLGRPTVVEPSGHAALVVDHTLHESLYGSPAGREGQLPSAPGPGPNEQSAHLGRCEYCAKVVGSGVDSAHGPTLRAGRERVGDLEGGHLREGLGEVGAGAIEGVVGQVRDCTAGVHGRAGRSVERGSMGKLRSACMTDRSPPVSALAVQLALPGQGEQQRECNGTYA